MPHLQSSTYLSYLTVYVTSGGEPSPGAHVKIKSKSFDSRVTSWGGGSWTRPDWKGKSREWLKISLEIGNITWFWPRWFQNLGQSSSVHLRLEISYGSRYVYVFLISCKTSSCQQVWVWTYVCVNPPFQSVLWLAPCFHWISQPVSLRSHLPLLIPSQFCRVRSHHGAARSFSWRLLFLVGKYAHCQPSAAHIL